MGTGLRPIGEKTLMRAIQIGVESGADLIHFRAGHPPTYAWRDGARRLKYRQLTGDDTEAIAGMLLERACIPDPVREDTTDAAHPLAMLCEIPDEALLHVTFDAFDGPIGIRVDLVRPYF